ncbi:hypothetical protein GNZ12_10085 [Paraburkholderia sp. 1N]|uniref:Uncharacterized protein n=1 Tax=Paraburkholderia solitsugae TaxID=2675748 RepID=A0ABX2BL42_9BURK|nr:hypothetical protein [Paraburkholderia solitsugae]NPT41664.1 hypothetical protein [Paraburkholderia solitsugae]
MTFEAGEAAMWRLVQRYTGRVGYRRGIKSEGLLANPPVIDCSGWTALLLTQALQAENEAAFRGAPPRRVFAAHDIEALHVWSDRIIHEIERRTGFILQGAEITADTLPRCAAIGLKMGDPAWAINLPRPRGITHIVQIVRRPEDDAPFVSEAFGGSVAPGIRLTPLAEWLARSHPHTLANEVWAVDAFKMASEP